MSRKLLSYTAISLVLGNSALADVPNVTVDIAPVHSLVARVMEGVGSPKLIIPAGASPHEYSLRPSEAKSLQDADMVFWMGEDLAPWLEKSIETLARDAEIVTLLEESGTKLLDFREGALFEEHDHDEHAHGAHDPHAWLSIANAQTWLNLVAGKLSAADPENAGVYFANAAAGRTEIDSLVAEVNGILAPVRGKNFVVFHDAYQYFETSFDFPAAGAISLGDATDPSPARIAEIQGRVEDEDINCVLSEPQYNRGLVEAVLSGTDAKTGIIDPLGHNLEAGPNLYSDLIRNMAKSLAGCL